MTDKSMGAMTSKPTSPDVPVRVSSVDASALTEGARVSALKDGLDPMEWEVKSAWQDSTGQLLYSWRRMTPQASTAAALTDAELDRLLSAKRERAGRHGVAVDGSTVLFVLGDMQFGKSLDGDGTVGTLARMFGVIDKAAETIEAMLERDDDSVEIAKVVVGFMGDHIEGFVSQGGANVFRTPMPLTEQIRITRRSMLYVLERFTRIGLPLEMVAVPGNHGEAFRPGGKGVTTYDDNHDTEALIAVSDAAKLSKTYRHVRFFVPETDELSVGLHCSGTYVVFNHGHMSRGKAKLMDWVKGQAFNRSSIYTGCDLAIFGHYHSLHMETSSDRTLIVAPSLESESTWFRHRAGPTGAPGALLIMTRSGEVESMEIIRADGGLNE